MQITHYYYLQLKAKLSTAHGAQAKGFLNVFLQPPTVLFAITEHG